MLSLGLFPILVVANSIKTVTLPLSPCTVGGSVEYSISGNSVWRLFAEPTFKYGVGPFIVEFEAGTPLLAVGDCSQYAIICEPNEGQIVQIQGTFAVDSREDLRLGRKSLRQQRPTHEELFQHFFEGAADQNVFCVTNPKYLKCQ